VVGEVEGGVGIRDGGIRSEGRSFGFSGGYFSAGKGGMGGGIRSEIWESD
jgi:hypothetical protein